MKTIHPGFYEFSKKDGTSIKIELRKSSEVKTMWRIYQELGFIGMAWVGRLPIGPKDF